MAAKKDSGGKATGKKAAGRKSECTDELWARFLEGVRSGLSDSAAAREIGFSECAVRKWHTKIDISSRSPQGRARMNTADADAIKEFREKEYNEACEVRIHVIESSLLDEMDALSDAAVDKDFANTRIQAIKVRIDTKKWLLSKMLRKKYGDSSSVELTGAEGKDLIPPANDELLREALAASREKLAAMERERREREDGTGS